MLYFFAFFMEIISFPNKKDAILQNTDARDIEISASGSMGQYRNQKCYKTTPNSTIGLDDPKDDWCSNIAKTDKEEDKPWISYSIKKKRVSLTGVSIRSGCCYYDCCCDEDGKLLDYYCCCEIYQFSVQGSNDFKNWKELGVIPETEPLKTLFVRLGYSKEDIAKMLKEF